MKIRENKPATRTFTIELDEREAQQLYDWIGNQSTLGGGSVVFNVLYDAGFRMTV